MTAPHQPPASHPVISVVMPSYNSGRYIGDAIKSILAQEGPPLELIIQDGVSTDSTVDVVSKFSDPRIRLQVEPDEGQTDAINRAVRRARGSWILWINADDMLVPGALAALGPSLDGEADLVHGDWQIVDEDGDLVKTYTCATLSQDRLLRHGAYLYHGAMLVRREIYERVGELDTRLDHCMDYEFMLRVSESVRVKKHDVMVAAFRMQPESKTSTQPWAQYRELWAVARRYGAFSRSRWVRSTFGAGLAAAYLVTKPLWYTDAWRRIRPAKRRAGRE